MRKIIFILIASTAILGIIALFIFLQTLQRSDVAPQTIPIPTKIPTSKTPGVRIQYNLEKSDELVTAATDRKQLSVAGATTKDRLIASLSGSSGVVYSSPNVKISYIAAPDLFQSEILSVDDIAAKQEATDWMISQGFTKDDLCKLPFSFFLGAASAQKYLNSSAVFNPLPEGC